MCPVKQGAQTQSADEFAFLALQQQRRGKAVVGFLSQIYIPSVARIAKQGSVLCFRFLRTAWAFLNVLHCRCFAHRRFYLGIDCFGRSSCAPNYADERKDVTKYSTCLESQNIRTGRVLYWRSEIQESY